MDIIKDNIATVLIFPGTGICTGRIDLGARETGVGTCFCFFGMVFMRIFGGELSRCCCWWYFGVFCFIAGVGMEGG